MVDKNKDYVTKLKLMITVKTLSEYNDRNKVAVKQKNNQTKGAF